MPRPESRSGIARQVGSIVLLMSSLLGEVLRETPSQQLGYVAAGLTLGSGREKRDGHSCDQRSGARARQRRSMGRRHTVIGKERSAYLAERE